MQECRKLGAFALGVYCVELDNARTRRIQDLMPDANVLGPASFHCTRISPGSFSLAYLNPPFDDELGGGKREEQTFVENAIRLIPVGGILVLVIPGNVLSNKHTLQTLIDQHFEDGAVYRFPDGMRADGVTPIRGYREVAVIGRRRKEELPGYKCYTEGFVSPAKLYDDASLPVLGTDDRTWTLPAGRRPKVFKKSGLTDQGLEDYVENSPLNRIFDNPPEHPMGRPPLPPFTAHIAQLLASGILDGVVEPPGEDPHVVRGTARKEFEKPDQSESVNEESGQVTEKTTYIQAVKLGVRTVDHLGTIRTIEAGEEVVISGGTES